MTLICVQCAMKAMLAGATTVPTFDETFDEHMARLHADPYTTYLERRHLERELAARMYPEASPRRRIDDWRYDSDDKK